MLGWLTVGAGWEFIRRQAVDGSFHQAAADGIPQLHLVFAVLNKANGAFGIQGFGGLGQLIQGNQHVDRRTRQRFFGGVGGKGVQVSGLDADVAIGIPGQTDMLQNGQCGSLGDDFVEARQRFFERHHGQYDFFHVCVSFRCWLL